MSKTRDLSRQQQKFIENYLSGMNLTDAYIKAGYKTKSRYVAGVNASQLMKNPKIRAVVDEAMEEQLQAARDRLNSLTGKAIEALTSLIEHGTAQDSVRLGAAKDILDRAGLKPEKVQEHSGEIKIIHEYVSSNKSDA